MIELFAVAGVVLVSYLIHWDQSRDAKKQIRYLTRQNEALTDKVMHMAGKTWVSPPADSGHHFEPTPRYTVSPEQDMDLNT